MSENYCTNGEISIDPPLKWSEIQKFPKKFTSGYRSSDPEVDLDVTESSTHTDEGEMILRVASSLVPNQWSGRYLKEHLQEILAIYPDHTFGGYIEVIGDSIGYGEVIISRIAIVRGEVVEFKPEIVWPKEAQ